MPGASMGDRRSMTRDDDGEDHLADGVIAAYVDRRLGSEERGAVASHLAECDACRAEVVEVARLVRGRRQPWILATAGLGVAAAVLVITLVPRGGQPPDGPVLRNGPDGAATIVAISPADSLPLLPDSVRFVWRAAGMGASYRVTVMDVRGDVVWAGNTADTAVTGDARFARGTAYFWYVDALLPDGRTATTGVRTFRTGP
jgi:hypothetical protein